MDVKNKYVLEKQINVVSKTAFEAMDGDDGNVKIVGYANTVTKDRHGDVIPATAWSDKALGNYLVNPIMLFNHDADKPIGAIEKLEAREEGLWVEGTILGSLKEADLVRNNILKAFSVGFSIKDMDGVGYNSETDTWILNDIELHEVSVVSIPANPQSIFSVAKSLGVSSGDLRNFKNLNETNEPDHGSERHMEKNSMDVDKNTLKEMLAEVQAEQAKKASAEAKAVEARKAELAEIAKAATTEASRQAAEVITELESKLSKSEQAFTKYVKDNEELISDLRDEIKAVNDARRPFGGGQTDMSAAIAGRLSAAQEKELDSLFITAVCKGVDMKDLSGTKSFVSKAVNQIGNIEVSSESYETTFSQNLMRDVELATVVAPLFRKITINSKNITIPKLPTGKKANWIGSAAYNDKANKARTGDEINAALTEQTLSTFKLGAKGVIPEETEEDAVMAVAPILRAYLVESLARAIDDQLVSGDSTTAAFDGLIKLSANQSNKIDTTATHTGSTKATAAMFQNARRNLGIRGMNANDLVAIVSLDTWYDLQEDPEWKDVNLVGGESLKLRGQVGSFYGIRVIVSEFFPTKASNSAFAVLVNPEPFIMTELRQPTVRTDFDIELDCTVMVATSRVGFDSMFNGGVAALHYAV